MQTLLAKMTVGERRFSALQKGREDGDGDGGWGCCGCRFSQHRLNKRAAFWFFILRQVPLVPRRDHEADAATPAAIAIAIAILAAALRK